MTSLGEYFRSRTAAQRWMIAAIALCAVSQFFLYLNDESVAGLFGTTDLAHYTQMVVFDYGAIGTGWQLHPQAYLLLAVLAFLFLRDDFAQSRWFVRYGYWIGTVLIFASITPAAPFRGAFGALLGLISLIAAICAAIVHGRATRAAARQPPPLTRV